MHKVPKGTLWVMGWVGDFFRKIHKVHIGSEILTLPPPVSKEIKLIVADSLTFVSIENVVDKNVRYDT